MQRDILSFSHSMHNQTSMKLLRKPSDQLLILMMMNMFPLLYVSKMSDLLLQGTLERLIGLTSDPEVSQFRFKEPAFSTPEKFVSVAVGHSPFMRTNSSTSPMVESMAPAPRRCLAAIYEEREVYFVFSM